MTKQTGWFLGLGLTILIGCNSPQTKSFQQPQTKEAVVYLERGNTLNNEGEYTEAISAYSKAIELNPGFYEALIKRGDLFCREKNEYDKALVDFNRAIEINSEKPDAYVKLAGVYLMNDDIDKALSIINKMLEVNSGDIAVCAYGKFMRAGLYFYLLRDYDKAIVDLTYIIDNISDVQYKDPVCGLSYEKFVKTCNQSYYFRGQAYREKGEYEKARSDFKNAVELDPQNINLINEIDKIEQLIKAKEDK